LFEFDCVYPFPELAMAAHLPTLLGKPSGARKASKGISANEDKHLMNAAVHTQHKDYAHFLDTIGVREQHVKTMKKKVIVPVEETVKVPVYRKEAHRKTEKVLVKGTKLVPVTKFKEVEETVLDVQEEMVNGHAEKRAAPVTRVRRIPYQDFEERVVEVEVEVPADEVVTRKGYREDRHVVSKVVEVEEDLVYEMRPVLVKKGAKRMNELGDHHAFKTAHGAPHWETDCQEGWENRPKTPTYRDDLHRPSSARSVRSNASSMVVPRLKAPKFLGADGIKSPSYFPRSRRHSVAHSIPEGNETSTIRAPTYTPPRQRRFSEPHVNSHYLASA
jgi:hypothetical protein